MIFKINLKNIFKKSLTLFKILLQLPIYILSIPFLLLIYSLSFFFLIRISKLKSSRIGPLAIATELYICEKKNDCKSKKKLDLFYFPFRSICNNQLAKMWRRKLIIVPEYFLHPVYQLNKILSNYFDFAKKHDVLQSCVSMLIERDIYNLLKKTAPSLQFTKKENELGKKFLNEMGLKKDDKFVCLIIRDEEYLKNFDNNDYSYHSFRNISVDKFSTAAEYIAKRGYFVFRMGKKVEKPFKSKNPKIIDYANLECKSDFLDIFLGANCFFCLSSTCGFDNVPVIFRKPVAYIEAPVATFLSHDQNSIVITRPHYLYKESKNLTFREIAGSEIARTFGTKNFHNLGIEIKDPSKKDILGLTKEMIDRLEGKWTETPEDKLLQEKFWRIYKSSSYTNEMTHNPLLKKKLHGDIKIKFGTYFLRKNISWLR